MEEKEITALAREYAEECAKGFAPADMPTCLKNEATGILVCNAEDVLRWITRRFCLVEKEAVCKQYQNARSSAREGYRSKLGTMIAVSEGRKALLESLFPEIAKEVEE